MTSAAAMAAASEASDAFTHVVEEGLDPGFDAIGELYDHVDGLSAWMRRGRAHPGHHDE